MVDASEIIVDKCVVSDAKRIRKPAAQTLEPPLFNLFPSALRCYRRGNGMATSNAVDVTGHQRKVRLESSGKKTPPALSKPGIIPWLPLFHCSPPRFG